MVVGRLVWKGDTDCDDLRDMFSDFFEVTTQLGWTITQGQV